VHPYTHTHSRSNQISLCSISASRSIVIFDSVGVGRSLKSESNRPSTSGHRCRSYMCVNAVLACLLPTKQCKAHGNKNVLRSLEIRQGPTRFQRFFSPCTRNVQRKQVKKEDLVRKQKSKKLALFPSTSLSLYIYMYYAIACT
jgi:hypothetical protein